VIRWSSLCVVLGLVGSWDIGTALSQAQTVERETKVTGPRGRTIDRRVDIERGPGTYQRQLQIQRPGGTLERSTSIQRGWGGGYSGGGFGYRPGPIFVGPRSVSSWGFGIVAAPMLTIPFWGAPPPPPVMVAPGMAGGIVQPGGTPVAPQAATAQPSPLDPVALAAQRLQSHHASSRRDGARELGRLGDPRAIPPLVYALKNDSSKDVKMAAATALGEIGGSEAEVVLERCIIYEKKQEVRDAAAAALRLLRDRRAAEPERGYSPPPPLTRSAPAASPTQTQQSEVPRLSAPIPSPGSGSSPFRPRSRLQEPPLDGPSSDPALPSDAERVPPPPPTPVKPS